MLYDIPVVPADIRDSMVRHTARDSRAGDLRNHPLDDCYLDVYQNACRLCGFAAFRERVVSSGFVAHPRFRARPAEEAHFQFENLTERDLREMAAGGFEIGAHTINTSIWARPLGGGREEIEGSVRNLNG